MFRRLSGRERLVVSVGAALGLAALLASYVAIPQARRWSEREEMISVRADQLARLQSVLADSSEVHGALAELRSRREAMERRLLAGPTVAVAASDLQLRLNRYVTDAGMELQRVDAVAQGADDGVLRRIPAQISVRGDVRGLVSLLAGLQDGDALLAVENLRVSVAPGRPGEPESLTAAIGLHGYSSAGEAGR